MYYKKEESSFRKRALQFSSEQQELAKNTIISEIESAYFANFPLRRVDTLDPRLSWGF